MSSVKLIENKPMKPPNGVGLDLLVDIKNNTMKEINKELYVQCSCGAEILKLEYDEEINSYYFAVFELDGRRSWKNKLRQIWHIIRYGEPYSDNMVLDSSEVDKIVDFINQINKERND